MTPHETIALGTFAADEHVFPGLVVGGSVMDLRRPLGADLTALQLLEAWDDSFEAITQLASNGDTQAHDLASLRPLPPVASRQILCAGANYRRHVQQMLYSTLRREGDVRSDAEVRAEVEAHVRRRAGAEPFIFIATPSALAGANDEVVLWGPGGCHDWELELAVVIGKPGRRIREDAAMGHVAGYTISNDISVRDVMTRPGLPMTDFIASKCRPTFFPTGPYLVPRQFVADPGALRIALSVNGDVMQDESTADMIYAVPELVAYASTQVDLFPGDLILTGSPAGNAGHHGNRWLTPGDLIEGSITGLGTQTNLCVAPPETQPAEG